MEPARADWNNDRLDHFAEQVEMRFEQVDRRFDEVDRRLGLVETDLREFRSETTHRLDGLQRTMVHAVVAMTGALIAGFAGIAGLIATQL